MFNRRLILIIALIFLSPFSFCSKKGNKDEPTLHSVGFSLRQFSAPADYNWRGSDEQTLGGIIWYPSEDSAGRKTDTLAHRMRRCSLPAARPRMQRSLPHLTSFL